MYTLEEMFRKVSKIVGDLDNYYSLISSAGDKLNRSYKTLDYIPPGFIDIHEFMELYVIGDLHGDYSTLVEIFTEERILDKLSKNDIKIVFLGDYIDRGPQQLEVMAFLLLLKTVYPEKIILLRGNHEPSPLLIPYPHDFEELVFFRYGNKGIILYNRLLRLFQRLPLIARVKGLALMMHGGPPSSVLSADKFEDAFRIGLSSFDDIVLEQILWSDPIEVEENGPAYYLSYRGAGILYGTKISFKAIELARVKYIIRAHEPVEGYKLNHKGRVVTLFDARIPHYGILHAGYIHIPDHRREIDNIEEYIKVI